MNAKPLPVFDVAPEENLWAVRRNGRYLMTPAGKPYLLPFPALAEAIAGEWRAQGEKILPATMPLSQIAATVFDIVAPDREKTIQGLLAYADSELLCQREAAPSPLAERQAALWQPFLDWIAAKTGQAYAIGTGVMPVRQKNELVAALRVWIESYDDFRLTGLSCATDGAGSLVLGLALAERTHAAKAIFEASELDVTHQAATWGEDPFTQGRQEKLLRELEACAAWFDLLYREERPER